MGARPQNGVGDMGTRKTCRAVLLFLAGVSMAVVAAPKPPNVILILADDLGYECLGCDGGASYKTPVLDQLAKDGVRFSACHAQPLCTPSRVKIMTGKYNFRNYQGFSSLPAGQTTFAHVMKEAGYATCIAGKWQLGGNEESLGAFGFDEYCLWQLHSYPVERRGSRYADPSIYQNGSKLEETSGKYGPDVFCNFINDFMERKKDRPFFVYYPMVLTHDPFVPTPDSPEWSLDRNKQANKYFKDMVEYTDKLVGKILEKVDELGLRENTLIIFTGDNGTSIAIKTDMKDGRTIRGGKGETTDNGTHVPLIVDWKGVAPAGKVCDDLVSFADFFPTLAQAAGAAVPTDVDGTSFLPQAKGGKGDPRGWLYMYANPRHGYIDRWASGPGAATIEPDSKAGKGMTYVKRFVMDGRWKLYSTGHLYDLKNDMAELNPVLPMQDTAESAKARQHLKNIFDSIK